MPIRVFNTNVVAAQGTSPAPISVSNINISVLASTSDSPAAIRRGGEKICDEFTSRMIPEYRVDAAKPLLCGIGVVNSHVREAISYVLDHQSSRTTACGDWLTRIADDRGVTRATGESDRSLRSRLVSFDRFITQPGIEASVNFVLGSYGLPNCFTVEWYQNGYGGTGVFVSPSTTPILDHDPTTSLVLNHSRLPVPRGFLVVLPPITNGWDNGSYRTIVATVDQAKAFGVQVTYVILSGMDGGPIDWNIMAPTTSPTTVP